LHQLGSSNQLVGNEDGNVHKDHDVVDHEITDIPVTRHEDGVAKSTDHADQHKESKESGVWLVPRLVKKGVSVDSLGIASSPETVVGDAHEDVGQKLAPGTYVNQPVQNLGSRVTQLQQGEQGKQESDTDTVNWNTLLVTVTEDLWNKATLSDTDVEDNQTVKHGSESTSKDLSSFLTSLTGNHGQILRPNDGETGLVHSGHKPMESTSGTSGVQSNHWTWVFPVSEPKGVVLWVTTNHGDESEEDQPNGQDNFTNTQIEFRFTKPFHSHSVQQSVDEDLKTESNSRGIIVSPEMDHTVNSGNFKRNVNRDHEPVVEPGTCFEGIVNTSPSHLNEWGRDRQERHHFCHPDSDTEDYTCPDTESQQQR
ncbi:hypothetical protein WICPIJ_008890, partial [Wickerhamomyces pijperi]